MLRRSIAAAALVTALAGAAPAFADTSVLFGNTLQVTHAGKTGKVYVDQGGTYTQVKADGSKVSGTWTDTEGKFCLTQTAPQPVAARCMPAITQKVGDTWTAGPGGAMTLSIVKGR
ncbi:hypothetical protein [Caulobacter sp. 17J65-9]|uniref:hypothetical protein n=1 Tax=Caulobacter sp. 17J65-9 TaxID=2709382 RepID=UPI0013C87955|nr:hypothetical protein [Caulobacter sp. 17J65-9]NEX92792.1 hypothetical protein [Caulobacter sp. 17J65-9]